MKIDRFIDEDKNQLELFINTKGLLFVQCGQLDEDYYNGCICLDKEDVITLIKSLKLLVKHM